MDREKTLLQICVALAGWVPVGAGAAGILKGVGMIPRAAHLPALDSHYAYLSGLLLAIGLAFWSCIPDIERRTARVRLLTAIVVVGGLGRAVAMLREPWGDSDDDVREAMSGNICRCGAYPGIVAAIQAARGIKAADR